MPKFVATSKRPLYRILISLLTLPLSAQTSQPSVLNSTPSAHAESHLSNGLPVVTIRNSGVRTIRAYMLRCGDVALLQEFVPPIHPGLLPGQVHERDFPIRPAAKPDKSSLSQQNSASCSALSLSAVLFDDGSAEGSANDIRNLKELRAGRVIQLNRIMALLREASTSDREPDAQTVLQDIARSVANLSLTLDDGRRPRHYTEVGMQNARQESAEEALNIAGAVRAGRQSPDSASSKFTDFISRELAALNAEQPVLP
jgi:hypothetical protein